MPAKHLRMAIAYDFDKTLSPINMQEHDFLRSVGIDSPSFWKKVKAQASDHDADEILCYMHQMLVEAQYENKPVRKEAMRMYGKDIPLFDGLTGSSSWFNRLNDYAKLRGVKLEHYVISSGVKSMIEGSPISKQFTKIYACDFIYDCDGKPLSPAVAINYTTKTQYLFRINKGCLNQTDSMINDFVNMADRPVPFENIVFIGDGPTDIPAMKMTNYQGGISIAVYPPGKNSKKAKKLRDEDRATFYAPADYSDNKKLDKIIKARIDEIVARNKLRGLRSN